MDALRYADEALAMAADDDEVALSHMLHWSTTRQRGLVQDIPAEVLHVGSPRVVMRLAQVNAINLAERGEFEASRAESERFLELALALGDPFRIWHAQVLQCMFLYLDGKFEEAEASAIENMKLADLHDIPQGLATYIGQQVYSADISDRLVDMGPKLEPFRATLSQLQLGRAAFILARHAAGQTDIGDELRDVVRDATNRAGSTLSLPTTIVLTRLLAEYTPDLVGPTRALLEPLGDNPVLTGFGVGSFGPTVRYVAQLATDPVERVALLDRSIKAADRHGPILWRVRTRLDRAAAGSDSSLAEAVELATGTELADVVDRYIARTSG